MGVADNFDNSQVVIGPGKIYADLAVPAHGGRLILDPADGAPSSSQNPDGKHIGYTREGATIQTQPQVTDYLGDESPYPLVSRVQSEVTSITGEILQVADFDLMEILMPTATRSAISGIDGIHFGGNDRITYTSIAIVAPLEEDPTLFWVAHLYSAFNNQGVAARVSRTALAGSPFAFQGRPISTRPAGDRLGVLFKQRVMGS